MFRENDNSKMSAIDLMLYFTNVFQYAVIACYRI